MCLPNPSESTRLQTYADKREPHSSIIRMLGVMRAAACDAGPRGSSRALRLVVFLFYAFPAFVLGREYRCLHNKTVHIMGNSVSRSRAYELRRILDQDDGSNITREQQKIHCGSGSNSAEGDECTLYANVTNTTIIFSWMWSVHSDSLLRSLSIPADFQLLNVGSHYVFTMDEGFVERAEAESVHLRSRLANYPELWFFRTTRLCNGDARLTKLQANTRLYDVDHAVLSHIWDLRNVRIFDSWTEDNACAVYDDHVHSAKLAAHHMHAWATFVCLGDRVAYRDPGFPGNNTNATLAVKG